MLFKNGSPIYLKSFQILPAYSDFEAGRVSVGDFSQFQNRSFRNIKRKLKKINEEVKEWFSLFFGNDLTQSGYDVPKMNYRVGGGSDRCDISLVVKQ